MRVSGSRWKPFVPRWSLCNGSAPLDHYQSSDRRVEAGGAVSRPDDWHSCLETAFESPHRFGAAGSTVEGAFNELSPAFINAAW